MTTSIDTFWFYSSNFYDSLDLEDTDEFLPSIPNDCKFLISFFLDF